MWVYDPDEFDAEIILDRLGNCDYTAETLAELFKCSAWTVRKAVREDRIVQPAFPWTPSRPDPHRWSREQVVLMLATGVHPTGMEERRAQNVREHGTAKGARQHEWREETMCNPCLAARRAHRRDLYSQIHPPKPPRVHAPTKGPYLKPREHGTIKGAYQHRNRKEQQCDACAPFMSELRRQWNTKQRAISRKVEHARLTS